MSARVAAAPPFVIFVALGHRDRARPAVGGRERDARAGDRGDRDLPEAATVGPPGRRGPAARRRAEPPARARRSRPTPRTGRTREAAGRRRGPPGPGRRAALSRRTARGVGDAPIATAAPSTTTRPVPTIMPARTAVGLARGAAAERVRDGRRRGYGAPVARAARIGEAGVGAPAIGSVGIGSDLVVHRCSVLDGGGDGRRRRWSGMVRRILAGASEVVLRIVRQERWSVARIGAGLRLGDGRPARDRQPDDEPRAALGPVRDDDPAIVEIDDRLRDRQAEAGPAGRGARAPARTARTRGACPRAGCPARRRRPRGSPRGDRSGSGPGRCRRAASGGSRCRRGSRSAGGAGRGRPRRSPAPGRATRWTSRSAAVLTSAPAPSAATSPRSTGRRVSAIAPESERASRRRSSTSAVRLPTSASMSSSASGDVARSRRGCSGGDARRSCG